MGGKWNEMFRGFRAVREAPPSSQVVDVGVLLYRAANIIESAVVAVIRFIVTVFFARFLTLCWRDWSSARAARRHWNVRLTQQDKRNTWLCVPPADRVGPISCVIEENRGNYLLMTIKFNANGDDDEWRPFTNDYSWPRREKRLEMIEQSPTTTEKQKLSLVEHWRPSRSLAFSLSALVCAIGNSD